MSQYFKVGKIVNTQGLRGEVRVISTTDFAEDRYQKGVELALFRDGEFEKLLTIKSHRRHKNFDLLTFEDHPRIEDVEGYRDCLLKVSSDALEELEEDEYGIPIKYREEIMAMSKQSNRNMTKRWEAAIAAKEKEQKL